MTDLPTKSQIVEDNWYSFLRYLSGLNDHERDSAIRMGLRYGFENLFWEYFLENKMEDN